MALRSGLWMCGLIATLGGCPVDATDEATDDTESPGDDTDQPTDDTAGPEVTPVYLTVASILKRTSSASVSSSTATRKSC